MTEPYSPAEDTLLLIKTLEHTEVSGVVVEVGCGVGAVLESIAGRADEVIGTDIQLEALLEARKRLTDSYGSTHLINARGLSCIRRNNIISLVVSNPPYLPEEPEIHDPTIHAGPTGVEIALEIVSEAAQIMAKGCRIILIASSLADFNRLKAEAAEKGLEMETLSKLDLFFERLICVEIRGRCSAKF